MLSSAPTTASPILKKPTSPTSLLPNISASPPDTSPPPLVDISVDSNSSSVLANPPCSWKTVSPALSPKHFPPSPTHKPKPMSPPQGPKPTCPPLPTQQPSALPKGSSRPPPRPASKPSSPALPRPPLPPLVSKVSFPPVPADQPQKPAPPSISILDKLIKTCPVWLQLGMSQDRAVNILNKESPGIFVVRRDIGQKLMIMTVRLPDQQGESQVQELNIKEEKSSGKLGFSSAVFYLFLSLSRDILPFTLKLPQAILWASKYEDMEVISTLGIGNTRAQDATDHSGSCEIQLSAGSDRLWYVNPVFIEEYCNSLPSSPPVPILRTQSLNAPIQAPPKYKRPPPLPPRPISVSEGALAPISTKLARDEVTSEEPLLISLSSSPPVVQKEEGSQHVFTEREGTPAPNTETETTKPDKAQPIQSEVTKQVSRTPSHRIPPVPLRRRLSENQSVGEEIQPELSNSSASSSVPAEGEVPGALVEPLICLDDNMEQVEKLVDASEQPMVLKDECLVDHSKISNGASAVTMLSTAQAKKPPAPVPPPRKKRLSCAVTKASSEAGDAPRATSQQPTSSSQQTSSAPTSTNRLVCVNTGHPKVPDVSLFSPEGGAPQPDHDSYSTSSTEEEADTTVTGALVKRSPTIMLDKAKQRLSMVNFSTVFTSFMSADRKLQKRIVELARDGNTYFGNLVQDYRAYTLDTMRRHSTSTEMLQEIRQMMTQLKSYLIQSTELQNLQEPATYSEDKLEIIIEAALCKSVLKPLREPIYNSLKDIHSRAGTLKRLKENQQIVLGTTTTDLGVTTSVPDTPIMEKIQVKLGNLHQDYSPQKKIDLLLKTCKIIYESMSVGCQGKAHGADDFLPVLLYVLARCNMAALLLDVEYMMELMDPALQLGEGEHRQTEKYTKQEIQDFINVSFLEAGSNTKTLGVRPNTTAQDLASQCADKFEVLEPDSYCLTVLVDGHYQSLTPEEFPLAIKSSLHHSEPRKEYYFVYRHGLWPGLDSGDLELPSHEPEGHQEDSLI
uniref:Ras and Rab interactor 3 n=1 Tax=Astyanax mexicanus TaxID=7994 RepID=W5KWX3_ASTMX